MYQPVEKVSSDSGIAQLAVESCQSTLSWLRPENLKKSRSLDGYGLGTSVRHRSRGESEFAVVILPSVVRRDCLNRIPMLRNFALMHTEQIVIRGGLSAKIALTHH